MTIVVTGIERVSIANGGIQGNDRSYETTFSPDGQKIVFISYASNLAPTPSDGSLSVYVRDLSTGDITLIANKAAGDGGNHESYDPVFSPDNISVSFSSASSVLVSGDTNNSYDIFVNNLTTGDMTRVSTDSSGNQANRDSYNSVFSPDGIHLSFYSQASNLVAGDSNGSNDVFTKNLLTGETLRVSTSAAGGQGNGDSGSAVYSPDGHKIAFASDASNLISGDTNGATDIFIKDLITGDLTRVSTDFSGGQANGGSSSPTFWFGSPIIFSPDGSNILFSSNASNLVADDTNGATDIFLKDFATGAISRVSTDAAGSQANGASFVHSISPDGTLVAFTSRASNLVSSDTNGSDDVFVKSLVTGEIVKVSNGLGGSAGNSVSDWPAFSPDGHHLIFFSYASNLVPGDSNGATDIFLATLGGLDDPLPASAVHVIARGTGQTEISDFTGVGRGIFISDAWKDMIDTLKFQGSGLTADKISLAQFGADTLISFHGINPSDTSVLLKNFDYQMLDNVPYDPVFNPDSPFGNFIFDGQTTVTDNVDVQNLTGNLATVYNHNTVTILNSLANTTNGFDGSNDVINAGGGADNIRGLSGNDLLRGEGGDDKLYGGSGNDKLYGGDGRDQLSDDSGNDQLYGGADNDRIWGGTGNDTIYGEAGSDTIFGGSGADYMDGGAGHDIIDYADSNAGVTLYYGNAITLGVGGHAAGDTLLSFNNFYGSNFDDIIVSVGTVSGRDGTLLGRGGNDVLDGGVGRDFINGGTGNDTITGGQGNDSLTGGTGTDIFVFNLGSDWGLNTSTGWSHDEITDFHRAEGDKIKITGMDAPSDFAAWSSTHILADSYGLTLIVDDHYNQDNQYPSMINVLRVPALSWQASDFIFVV